MTVKRTSRKDPIERVLAMLRKSRVLVGIPAEAGRDDGGPSNAVLGYLHEYGEPERDIPARPFLRPGAESVGDKIVEELQRGAQRAVAVVITPSGSFEQAIPEVDKALHRIGLVAQNAVRARLSEGIPPPLSPRTIYARLHRKKGRRSGGEMKPLIDSGQLRRSVTYVVETRR